MSESSFGVSEMKKMYLATLLVVSLFFSLNLLHFSSSNLLVMDIELSAVVSEIDMESIREHMFYLESVGSRVSGYAGNIRAGEYIGEIFGSYLTDVEYENFTVVMPIDYGANLTASLQNSTRLFKIYPLWPNLASTVSTPPEGITGHLIYADDGELSDFSRLVDSEGKMVQVRDSIVVMEFNSERRWLNLAAMGAKAVIFLEPETSSTNEASHKSIPVPLSFPRFYVKAEHKSELIGLALQGDIQVTLFSKMVWERTISSNIIGYVQGTELPDEIMAISAHYDSFSVVPSVAPGAQETTGIAVLLELAKFFSENPPKRTMMFVAYSGHHQAGAGSRMFTEDYAFGEKMDIGSRIKLIVNLDLATESNVVAPFLYGGLYNDKGDTVLYRDRFAPLGKFITEDIRIEMELILSREVKTTMDGINLLGGTYFDGGWVNSLPLQVMVPFDHQPLLLAGGPSIGMVTVGATRNFRDLPIDTVDHLEFDNLEEQVEFLYCIFFTLSNLDGENWAGIDPSPSGWKGDRMITTANYGGGGFAIAKGTVAYYNYTIAWYTPLEDALVFVSTRAAFGNGLQTYPYAKWWESLITVMTSSNGEWEARGLPWRDMVDITTYKVDEFGNTIYAPDNGKYQFGPQNFLNLDRPISNAGISTVFRCGSIVLFDAVSSGTLLPTNLGLGVSSFQSHTTPDSYSSISNGIETTGDGVAIIFVSPNEEVEILVSQPGSLYPQAVINATLLNPSGKGYSVGYGEQLRLWALNYVNDLHYLNGFRIEWMASSGLDTSELGTRHNITDSLIKQATNAFNEGQYDQGYYHLFSAWTFEQNLFGDVRGSIQDTIISVPFFAALLIPFAFLLERLIFSFEGTKRFFSLVLSVVVFMIPIMILHPGFNLIVDVSLIFIGFVLIVLVSPVLLIIMSRILNIIHGVSESRMGVHSAALSSGAMGDAIMVSFSTGLQHMKKKKFRTTLTIFSVILIVTGLVLFSTFSIEGSVTPSRLGRTPTYEGLMVRPTPAWGHINTREGIGESAVDLIQKISPATSGVSPRAWLYTLSKGRQAGSQPISIGFGENTTNVYGVLGLAPEEVNVTSIQNSIVQGTFFLESMQYPWICIISQDLAAAIEIEKIGDHIETSFSPDLIVVGIISDPIFNSIRDLDGEAITPIEITTTAGAYTHLPISSIIILPYKTTLMLGGTIISVSVRTDDPSITMEVASQVSEQLDREVWAGSDGQAFMLLGMKSIELFGVSQQIVPILICVATIMNLMLGMVYERRREIQTYSIIGLSPLHISGMFVSESFCYAILGSVTGYIVAMAVMQIGSNLGELPFQNYSAAWVILPLGISMIAMIVSTLYPVLKASRLATPSLQRRWQMTKPSADDWEIHLPYRTKKGEVLSFIRYVKEFVEAHLGDSAEYFSVSDIKSGKDEADELINFWLSFKTKLAPYEMGVRQLTRLTLNQKKDEEYFHLLLLLHREGGSGKMWEVLNRNFIDVIRKQILIFQSLDPKERSRYENADDSQIT